MHKTIASYDNQKQSMDTKFDCRSPLLKRTPHTINHCNKVNPRVITLYLFISLPLAWVWGNCPFNIVADWNYNDNGSIRIVRRVCSHTCVWTNQASWTCTGRLSFISLSLFISLPLAWVWGNCRESIRRTTIYCFGPLALVRRVCSHHWVWTNANCKREAGPIIIRMINSLTLWLLLLLLIGSILITTKTVKKSNSINKTIASIPW